ncbi:MAG: tetratricopeptide repeat protein [Planctomycetes bacterium]|nr:tetratricopeptide repeat protein [Planctomycetota bacterium]
MKILHTILFASFVLTFFIAGASARDIEDVYYEGLELLDEGKYQFAVSRFERVLRADESHYEAHVALIETRHVIGELTEEEAAIESALQIFGDERELRFLKARLLFDTGRYDEAKLILAKALEESFDVGMRLYHSKILWNTGNRDEALGGFSAILSYANANRGDLDARAHPEKYTEISKVWMYVGEALVYLAERSDDLYQDAQKAFLNAISANERNYDAIVSLGYLYLWNDLDVDARDRALSVIGKNNHHPGANLLAALCFLAKHNRPEADKHFVELETQNPNLMEFFVFRTETALGNEDYDGALELAGTALGIDPVHPKLRALHAVCKFMLGKTDEFEAEMKQMIEFNPSASDIPRELAGVLNVHHRFDEALAFAEKALELSEFDWRVYVHLGDAHFRLGDLEKAREAYQIAYRRDSFRNRLHTRNKLQLLEKILGFDRRTSSHFNIFCPIKEREVFGRLATDFAEEAYRELSAKYEFEPRTPINLELYDWHNDFEVRILGLTGVPGILGVCFGQVVAMDSPTARLAFSGGSGRPDTVWAKTLWHEMAHVYQIQISRGRVPRWLAEGMSVYEEWNRNPEWRREMDLELANAYNRKDLLKLANIDSVFQTANIMFAYYQGGEMVTYITQRWNGVRTLKEMLERFADDYSLEFVIENVLSVSVEEFDEGFRTFVGEKVGSFNVPKLVSAEEFDDLDLAVEEKQDAHAAGVIALNHYLTGNKGDAEIYSGLALMWDPKNIEARVVRAHLAYERGDIDSATLLYEEVLAGGYRDFLLELRVARIYARTGNVRGAEQMFKQAIESFPYFVGEGNGYLMLAQFEEVQGNQKRALDYYEKYLAIAESDYEVRTAVADIYKSLGQPEAELHHRKHLLWMWPFDSQLHLRLSELCDAAGDSELRIKHLELAIACDMEDPAEIAARIELGGLYLQYDRLFDCRDQIERVEFLSGGTLPAEAEELKKKLRERADELGVNIDGPRPQ